MTLRALFVGLSAFGFAQSAHPAECKLSSFGTLPVEMQGAKPTALARINGRETRFLVDTGAWFGTMSEATAKEHGLPLQAAPQGLYAVGVGGTFSLQVARVRELGLLGAAIPRVDFLVGGTDFGMPILGANMLNYFDLELDLGKGQLRLMDPHGCDKQHLAYWAGSTGYEMADLVNSRNRRGRQALVRLRINGKPVEALLDTGANATVIGKRAAARVGLDLRATGVTEGEASTGFGRKAVRTWTVPVAEIAIGSEAIRHTRIQVLDEEIGGDGVGEMLLGIDFILAHRIYVANSQGRIYFTYNGGRVFTPGGPPPAPLVDADKSPLPAEETDKGQPAAFFAARATARQARGDLAGALADYDAAIRLAPDQVDYCLNRARARGAAGQEAAARQDLAQALKLDPAHALALLMRARMYRTDHQPEAALADVAAAVRGLPPGSPYALDAAELYNSLERPASALPLLDGWIALHPVDARLGSVLNARCWTRGLANQVLDGAASDCRKAIKRDGTKAAYLDSLGLILLRTKAFADAIATYQQALALEPDLAWSRYGLGLARIRSGQTNDGAADLAAATRLDSTIAEKFARYGI